MLAQRLSICLLAVSFGLVGSISAESVLPEVGASKSYVVIASEETAGTESWRTVIDVLRQKYDASLILYPKGQFEAVLPALKKIFPRYAAFVAPPEEAGRSFVVDVSRLTRKLDDDPYTDVLWGIVTGYDAADALRIAKCKEPLVIKSAASSMGPGSFKNLDHGFASSETDAKKFWLKKKGSETEELEVDPDPVKSLVYAFNAQSPDMFVTSGHASERDWQVIYNKDLGTFRCKDGQLYGLNSKGERFDINSQGAKIYLPMGNCLIGHIPGRDCMAAAWMHTGGVNQMFGYTAVTFHGYMGWGIGSFFGNQYSLTQSFYFNNQSLILELQTLFPEQAGIEFDNFDHRGVSQMARKYKIADQKLMGHLWDRDVVAFYGDPAWVARHSIDDPAWKVGWKHVGEVVEIMVTVLKDGKWGNRPLAIPFPVRLDRIRGVDCSDGLKSLVCDDFALLPVMDKERKAGDTISLRFSAIAVASKPTSATAAPILAESTAAVSPSEPADPVAKRLVVQSNEEARGIAIALQYAQKNREELAKALQLCEPQEVPDMSFLIANMPLRDLTELSADYLLENMRYARKAFAAVPWRDQVGEDLYREYILPYASLTEKREEWRKSFYEQLLPLVKGIGNSGEAAVKLNQTIFKMFNVNYHATKRPKPDQGPLESIEASYASCTGLSVLLVDACRAVGIPARVAGVAQWTKGPGNHTWVEVWDNGWHCLGSSESKQLDEVWFGKGAAAADDSDPMKRVYAACFSRGALYFPIAWNPYANYVPAVDVTDWYKLNYGEMNTKVGE